jgi:hypothetical protein
MRTMMDEQAEALSEEFHPFQVWVDSRPQDDGHPHWHARRPGWLAERNLHATDAESIRREILTWKKENEGSL